MTDYSSDHLRNVALVGHGSAGKTSLASAVLYNAGMVNRLGRIDDGTTVTDYDEDEIQKRLSISLTPCYAESGKMKVNIVDTPGFGDFVADARAALRVVEGAVLAVCGVSGVEVYTEKTWEWARDFGVVRLAFINKLDRERADFDRALASLKDTFGDGFVPLAIPIGKEGEFQGVIDLFSMKAHYAVESGKSQTGEIPEELKSQAESFRESLVEAVVEVDDELLEKYLEGETVAHEELREALRKGVLDGSLFPVLCGSATKNIGTDLLLRYVLENVPSPVVGDDCQGKSPSGDSLTRPRSGVAPFSAYVFKTIADPYAGKITLFRVFSGSLQSDSSTYNSTRTTSERVGHLLLLQGKESKSVPQVVAGDIAAVAKLKATGTGDTLCDASDPICYESLPPLPRLMSFAIEPKSRGDEEKITSSIKRLCEEDPTLEFSREEQTKQLILSGMGQQHIEVALGRLKRKFGVEATLKLPKIPYLETLAGKADIRYRHKKQTGGAGQFGECAIRIMPNRGEGFEFIDKIVGGVIPAQYIPSVKKGVLDKMKEGVLAGFPVVDVRVELYDGKYHPVDSKDIAFQIAGRQAFKEGALKAKPVLLEPIMILEVVAPEEKAGDIMGDLNSRRGRVLGMEAVGRKQRIRAEVPLAEVQRYAPDLQSMTGGRGTFSLEFCRYDQVPALLQDKIVQRKLAEKEAS